MAAWMSFRGLEDDEEKEWGSWEYDSTWESEEEEEEGKESQEARADGEEEESSQGWFRGSHQASGAQEQRRPAVSSIGYRGFEFLTGRNWTAAKDMQRYRHCYPGLKEREPDAEEEEMWNLSFYKNEIHFLPHGLFIDELLEAWQEDYETLEENHSYIQWLFPLRERGMNWRAKPLTCKEIQAFKKSKEVMQRFIRAYKLMLGFYGINLIDQETGEVQRAENWHQRFRNLDRFSHNNLRITRILKCLGEMGYEHYQVRLVSFFLTETLVCQTLPNVKRSALDYFLFTIRNKQKRRELIHYAWMHFKPQDKFAWGPRKKLQNYKPPSLKSQHCQKAEEEKESVRDKEAVGKNKTNPPNREEKVGDAAYSETNKVTDECTSKEQSKRDAMYVAERGDNVEEKEASLSQLEEKVLSEDLVGLRDGAESECLKESKKRKLEMNRLIGKCTGLLKSPTDIEKISYNLGEFAIDQETTETLPALPEKGDQVTAEEGDVHSEDFKASESSDAPVKRRKVDEAMPENSTVNVAINLDTDTTTCNVQATGAEKGEVSEEDTVVEEINVKTENGAEGASVNSLPGSETNEPGLPSLAGSGSVLRDANSEIQKKAHQCNETLTVSESQVDDREQKEGAEDVHARGETKTLDKNWGQEGLQQSVVESHPEKVSARNVAQEMDCIEDSAKLPLSADHSESGKNIAIAPEQGAEEGHLGPEFKDHGTGIQTPKACGKRCIL
ncbi:opioid growth factor receptor isoform X2 [Malaclemys terrapin pileata]|uniref:opioid growth factor receptor isoform X2 n=1 Tax=Malaclemys terrapin pileata TaxID=2991368 RepID=UPI0023A847DB|nr:opioid growth factor receptor isoform X2 [Malaclemys terrapin pileata]